MATEIVLVKVGMTMTEGTLSEWLVEDGAAVAVGEPLYRLETEKVDMDVEAEAAGTVRHVVAAGETVEVGTLLGYVLAAGEPMPSGANAAPAATASTGISMATGASAPVAPVRTGERVFASPIARRLAKERRLDLDQIVGTGPGGRIVEADIEAAVVEPAVTTTTATRSTERILASPVAQALAQQRGIDIATVRGTGPGGRITREDVAHAKPGPSASGASRSSYVERLPDVVAVKGMRKVISQRMHASLQEMAQLTLGTEVVMDEAVRFRSLLLAEWEPEGVRVSVTDMVVKAVARALTEHPYLNSTLSGDEILLHPAAHVGLAVAVEDGLVVPVIRDADTRSLKEIAVESTRLADLARGRRLGLDDMSGSTFSVTALGAQGIDFFTPIVNPPNVAILGVGRMREGVAWEGDHPVKQTVMTLSLTIDHRVVDGAPGAAFLGTVRDILQTPYRLVI